jgi:enoyl-CoA hydratase/carnithine racemase
VRDASKNGCRWSVEPSGVAVITLDSPPVNALEPTIATGLRAALDSLELADVRALIVESAGRVFCAGADLIFAERCIEGGADGHERMLAFNHSLQGLYSRIEALPMPTIAAIDGAAVGGGLELALACDIRIAGTAVRVGLPEVTLGLIPGAGGTQRLTRLVGPGTAAAIMLGGELLTGDEALARGLVQYAVDTEQVRSVARELAVSLAARSPAALESVKRCIALAGTEEGYAAELECTVRLLKEPATISSIRTFLSSRSARSTNT